MAEAYLGLGGNLGDVRSTLQRAIDALCDGREVRLVRRSSDYRTLPWGRVDQPAFVNACAAVHTDLTPRALLEAALGVEASLGRDRATEERWGPRLVDIDLLAYGDAAMSEPGLIVPHPRLFERAFALVPLAEIAPDLIIAGRRVREVLEAVDTVGVERLGPPEDSNPLPGGGGRTRRRPGEG